MAHQPKQRQQFDDSNIPPQDPEAHMTEAQRRAESRLPLDQQDEVAREENAQFQPRDITHGARDHTGTVTPEQPHDVGYVEES